MTALDSMEVEGYKSIRSAKIDLGAINVLIGANGSGKSNLVSLFGLLADLADHRLQLHIARQGGADATLHFGRKKTSALRVALRFGYRGYEALLVPGAADTLVFEREMPLSWEQPLGVSTLTHGRPLGEYAGGPGRKETSLDEDAPAGLRTHPVVPPLAAAMKSWRPFHFHDTGQSAPTKRKHQINDNRVLRAEGDNLAPYLFALRATAPGAYRRVVEAMRSIAPFFENFALEPDAINPDMIPLTWRHESDDALFTADSLSDGTLRFICLATLLLQPVLPSLIVIDERELGLHPFAIVQLAAMVRAVATRTQVILATQSMTLLDQFGAGEVIATERINGESSFRRLDEAALSTWKQKCLLWSEAEQARWLAENQNAVDYYNAFVEEHGLFGDEFRPF